MKKMFSEHMSSNELRRVFFNYADKHRGENIENVKREYREIAKKVLMRELKTNAGAMTSDY